MAITKRSDDNLIISGNKRKRGVKRVIYFRASIKD